MFAAAHNHVTIARQLLARGIAGQRLSKDTPTPAEDKEGYNGSRGAPKNVSASDLNNSYGLPNSRFATLVSGSSALDLNLQDFGGWSALFYATKPENLPVAELLLTTDSIEADMKDSEGFTPLDWAIFHGSEPLAHSLLERADIDPMLLLSAAERGHGEVVASLFANSGADAHMRKTAKGREPRR
jgi:ankyrin repeat protein